MLGGFVGDRLVDEPQATGKEPDYDVCFALLTMLD